MENEIIDILNNYIDNHALGKSPIDILQIYEKLYSFGITEYLDNLNIINVISIFNNKILMKLCSSESLFNKFLKERMNISYEEVINFLNNNIRSTIPNCFNGNLEELNYNNPIEKGFINKYINNLLNLDFGSLKDAKKYFEKLAFLINHRNSKRMGFSSELKCKYIEEIIKNKKKVKYLRDNYGAVSFDNKVIIYVDSFKNIYKSDEEQFKFIFDLYHENEHIMQNKQKYKNCTTYYEYNYYKNLVAFKDFDVSMDYNNTSAIELDADYYAAIKMISDIENGYYDKFSKYLSKLYEIRDKRKFTRFTKKVDTVNEDIIDLAINKINKKIAELKEKKEYDKNKEDKLNQLIKYIYEKMDIEYDIDGSKKSFTQQISAKNKEYNKILGIIKSENSSDEEKSDASNYLKNGELEKLYYPILYRTISELEDNELEELSKNEIYYEQMNEIVAWKINKIMKIILNHKKFEDNNLEVSFLKNQEEKIEDINRIKCKIAGFYNSKNSRI